MGKAVASHATGTRRSVTSGRPVSRSVVLELGQHLVRDVGVGVDVLHVVEVLDGVDQPNTLRAPSASSGTCSEAMNVGSAESYSMPALLDGRADGDQVGRPRDRSRMSSPMSLTSSAPASSTAISRSSSVRSPALGTDTTPLRLNR